MALCLCSVNPPIGSVNKMRGLCMIWIMIIAIFRRSVTGQLILNEYFWAVVAQGLWGMKNNLYFMPYPLFDPGNHHLNIRYISKNVHIYSFSIIYFSL